jgi:hypothetical protein
MTLPGPPGIAHHEGGEMIRRFTSWLSRTTLYIMVSERETYKFLRDDEFSPEDFTDVQAPE